MYGHIHVVIRDLVLETFGSEAFDVIMEEAKFNEGKHFLQFDYFGDGMTISLIMAVSKCQNLPLNEVLELFGDFFLRHCLRHGYDNMLRTLGRDMTSFIQNLDSLHSLLLLTYDKLVAPSFRCKLEENGSMTLHYYSSRVGLSDIVKGVVRAVGREIFQQKVQLELLSTETSILGGGKSQEHSVFTVHFLDEKDRLKNRQDVIDTKARIEEAKSCPRKRFTLSGEMFCEHFSYHVIFDENLVIQQCGDTLERMLGVNLEDNPTMSQAFKIFYPQMNLTIQNIRHFINSIFVLIIIPVGDQGVAMNIKGQMINLEEHNMMMFIGSPLIKSLNEMKAMDVYMADIPLFDVTREIVLLYEQRSAEIGITKMLDLTTAELQKTSRALETERKKTENLLHEMLPPKVARALMNGIKVDAETFKRATIMFSDVVTFTNIAAACTPAQIVDMLNDMYERFDNATTRHGVYKVETIGDAYMVVCGVPERTKDHPQRVGRFSMDIVAEAARVMSPASGKPLQIRVGVHTGPVMAGVVGVKMPRYCLFGDTVNTASRMESHGIPGRIHLSPHAFRSLRNIGFTFKRRGEMEVKGKGRMVTHFLISDGKESVAEPQDDFTSYPILGDAELILDGDGDVFPEDDEVEVAVAVEVKVEKGVKDVEDREDGDGSEGRKESGGSVKEKSSVGALVASAAAAAAVKKGVDMDVGSSCPFQALSRVTQGGKPPSANASPTAGSRVVVPNYSYLLTASQENVQQGVEAQAEDYKGTVAETLEVPPPRKQGELTAEEKQFSKTCLLL